MGQQLFSNEHHASAKRSPWHIILWQLGFYKEPTLEPPPEDFVYPIKSAPFDPSKPSLLWIGHNTFLLKLETVTILTDPIFSSYCAPFPLMGLRRLHPPAVDIDDLERLDLVLISHNHYDHLDVKSVKRIHARFPNATWIVPKGLSPWFLKRNISRVQEVAWHSSFEYAGVKILATPCQHYSGRGLFDHNKSHWNGYVVESGKEKIYYTGDTGYNVHDFKEIGKRYGPFDLALIPIGTYKPEWFMRSVHLHPEDAVKIHQEVLSKFSVGMHFHTFCLSDEPRIRPPYDLFLEMQKAKLDPKTFIPLEPGQSINFGL